VEERSESAIGERDPSAMSKAYQLAILMLSAYVLAGSLAAAAASPEPALGSVHSLNFSAFHASCPAGESARP
jgi:hypothetical protein